MFWHFYYFSKNLKMCISPLVYFLASFKIYTSAQYLKSKIRIRCKVTLSLLFCPSRHNMSDIKNESQTFHPTFLTRPALPQYLSTF